MVLGDHHSSPHHYNRISYPTSSHRFFAPRAAMANTPQSPPWKWQQNQNGNWQNRQNKKQGEQLSWNSTWDHAAGTLAYVTCGNCGGWAATEAVQSDNCPQCFAKFKKAELEQVCQARGVELNALGHLARTSGSSSHSSVPQAASGTPAGSACTGALTLQQHEALKLLLPMAISQGLLPAGTEVKAAPTMEAAQPISQQLKEAQGSYNQASMQVRATGQAKVTATKSLEDARAMLDIAQAKMDKAMADETLAEAQLKLNGDKLEIVKAKHVATIAKLKQDTETDEGRARAPKRRTDHEVSSEEDKLLENLAGLRKSEAAKGTVASIDALHAAIQS